MNYYHYTKGCHLAKILNEGLIKTSKNFLDKGEKPAAWLTKSPQWDVSCNIGKVLNADDFSTGQIISTDEIDLVAVNNDYMKKEIGMCRILINEKLPVISWAKFKHVSGISESSYKAIDQHSRSIGSPVNEWLCTFSGIPRKYWESIEMYVDDQWVRWDEKIPIQEFVDLCLSCNGKQEEEEELNNGFPNGDAQGQMEFIDLHYEEMKVILSDFVKMKYETLDELTSKGDYKQLEEFHKSAEYNKFFTIQDLDGFEDENGNELIMFFDDSIEFENLFVYTVNTMTLEVDVLLIENDFKKAQRFFYGFKYSDKHFEIVDNLDDGESLMSTNEDGVWVNYVEKFENDEFVSTIELNEYRLNKGLKPIDYDPFEDSYKKA